MKERISKQSTSVEARMLQILLLISAMCIALICLSGCTVRTNTSAVDASSLDASTAGSAADASMSNTGYMSLMNEKAGELSQSLSSFNDAVSREDLVGMQTQAESALSVIDDISDIEAPEDMGEIHEKYVSGCDDLRDALLAYVELYSNVLGAQDGISAEDYSEQLSSVQDTYDSAIDSLEEADELAAELQDHT